MRKSFRFLAFILILVGQAFVGAGSIQANQQAPVEIELLAVEPVVRQRVSLAVAGGTSGGKA